MPIDVWTWGTGAAHGRVLTPDSGKYRQRNQIATSIISSTAGEITAHVLVDAGAPCVETMITSLCHADSPYRLKPPEVLCITHPHSDHFSDFEKLVYSRQRGLSLLSAAQNVPPLLVVGTRECLKHPTQGLQAQFAYARDKVVWLPLPAYDVWYSLDLQAQRLLPTAAVTRRHTIFPMDVKALPVSHPPHAPGASLFIFRSYEEALLPAQQKRIVISGDFESIADSVLDNRDLHNPSFILLETNTLHATGTNHTNWEQNKGLLRRWITSPAEVIVALHHLSGFEDQEQGYYPQIPTEEDWQAAIDTFSQEFHRVNPGSKISITLAKDGDRYSL